MNINNFGWWLIVFFNLFAYFIFRFGMISRGHLKNLIEFVGGSLIFVSFVLMFVTFGLKNGVILILIFWLVVTPIVEILIKRLEKKLYADQLEIEKKIAQKLNMTPDKLSKYKDINDKQIENMMEEMLPGFNKRNEVKK